MSKQRPIDMTVMLALSLAGQISPEVGRTILADYHSIVGYDPDWFSEWREKLLICCPDGHALRFVGLELRYVPVADQPT